MKSCFKSISFSLVASALLAFSGMFYGCNEKEPVAPGEIIMEVLEADGTSPYTVTFAGISKDGKTWNYTVERTGPAQGNGLSHVILGLGTCLNFNNVVSASIDSIAHENIQSTEGSGTGCSTAVGANIIKFDGLPSALSSGVHTFSVTVDKVVAPALVPFWVKPGNSCYLISEIAGPGCDTILNEGCSLSQGYWFAKPGSWASKGYKQSTITVGEKEYTEAEAAAIWNSSNKGGKKDAKMAFLQVATIKLTQAVHTSIKQEASVWAMVNDGEAFLSGLQKLATTSADGKVTVAIPLAADANKAGGKIGEWISKNHCE